TAQRSLASLEVPAAGDGPGGRYARAALAEELARVAAAPVGQRNRQLWESARNLYNLVAAGGLDQREVPQGPPAGARRWGGGGGGPAQAPPHPGLRPPGRPRSSPPPTPTHHPRTHPC